MKYCTVYGIRYMVYGIWYMVYGECRGVRPNARVWGWYMVNVEAIDPIASQHLINDYFIRKNHGIKISGQSHH